MKKHRRAQHPTQPIRPDKRGVQRFKVNKIVEHLYDHGVIKMNELARLKFSPEDRVQFAQLIGYSIQGFGELSYVSDKAYERAVREGGYNLKTDRPRFR